MYSQESARRMDRLVVVQLLEKGSPVITLVWMVVGQRRSYLWCSLLSIISVPRVLLRYPPPSRLLSCARIYSVIKNKCCDSFSYPEGYNEVYG